MTLSNDRVTGVLKITGTLDIDGADTLREALLDSFLHQLEVTVNMASVDFCDTAALQVLLAARRKAEALGKPFRVEAGPPSVTELAAAVGLALDGECRRTSEDA